MAIINSIENIVVKSGKDFKRNEMQDMFTPRAKNDGSKSCCYVFFARTCYS